MAYNALLKMRGLNQIQYKTGNSVFIPSLPDTNRNYGKEALAFIRDCCEDLKFDFTVPERAILADSDGKSAGKNQIPYNMERDLDRLSFERAVGRFLSSGSREDAFDIYYCYCEIFKPFGTGYDSAGLLLELLSEHEVNAGALLMKYRDHYSHSVYIFLLGLSIYKNHDAFRKEYQKIYNFSNEREAACHFLEFWGLAALFHDVGYPFEIVHQQIKTYVCALDNNYNDDYGFAPYVSYRNMDEFTVSRLGDLNDLYARAITDRLKKEYFKRTETEPFYAECNLKKALKDRAIRENPEEKEYLYLDHAYFSGLIMAKTYISRHIEIDSYEKMPASVMDAFCAIVLHNSMFRFTIRSFAHTKQPLKLTDGQPLAYLLILCDELQRWDRTCYGQNSRTDIFAFDFDIDFPKNGMHLTYYFDKEYEEKVLNSNSYKMAQSSGYIKKSGAVREQRSKLADDIDEVISLKDMVPAFEPDVEKPDPGKMIDAVLENKQKKTGLHLSDSNYLNLYKFALALNGRYAGVKTADEMKKAFEENLSLEYKLSNIAQAKGFAAQLEAVGCFYTDRAVDYIPVNNFHDLVKVPGHEKDMYKIAKAEHNRWCSEKKDMGWRFGTAHINAITAENGEKKDDSIMRERTRLHNNLTAFRVLSDETRKKDTEAMNKMLELIREYEGLTIYRMR